VTLIVTDLNSGNGPVLRADRASLVGEQGGVARLASALGMDAPAPDPVRPRGADVRAGPPMGPGADSLKHPTSEFQMWLRDHPVNMRRVQLHVKKRFDLLNWPGSWQLWRRPRPWSEARH
jgi:hypothetical protein